MWLQKHGGREALAMRLGGGANVGKVFLAALKASCRPVVLSRGQNRSHYGAGIVDAVKTLQYPITPSHL